MKSKLLIGMLLAGSSLFAATRISIGVGIGNPGFGYVAPPPVVAYRTPSPGYGYTWVDGYWYQAGPRRFWREGYWARPVYRGRIAPRFENHYYGRDEFRYDRR